MTSQPEHVARARSGDTTVQGGSKQVARDVELALVLLLGRVANGHARFVLGTEPVRVGRHAEGNHVHLVDPRSSRRHAEIYWSEIHRQHWVRDLEAAMAFI